MKSRIELNDSLFDVVSKMSEGNPGAMNAIIDIIKGGKDIDPQGFMGGLGAVLMLDTWKIYGSDIYILYSDKCGRDLRKMMLLMRAVQLGFMPESRLRQLADDQSRIFSISPEEWEEIDSKVCGELEEFQRA